jgi:uncharacterized membrane protein YraQ (UPF0718 family)
MSNFLLPDMMSVRMGGGEEKRIRRTTMERMQKIAKRTGKVVLALLAGVLMPVLVWAAVGVAARQALKAQQRTAAPATV